MRAAEIWEHFIKFSTSNHKSGEKAKGTPCDAYNRQHLQSSNPH